VDGFSQLHRLTVDVSSDASLLVDTVAFSDVVGILVENAISHSPIDAPVSVSARLTGPDVRVSVTNPGSLPADLDPATLFRPFHRGGDARSSGVGLGLYIAARLADSMDAQIEVSSGEGLVTFTLRVPRYAQDAVVPVQPTLARVG
jgi:signal transduction histidine kinase